MRVSKEPANRIREYVERERANRRRRQFTITVSADIGEYIDTQAKEAGVSKSAVVAFALQRHKEERERLREDA